MKRSKRDLFFLLLVAASPFVLCAGLFAWCFSDELFSPPPTAQTPHPKLVRKVQELQRAGIAGDLVFEAGTIAKFGSLTIIMYPNEAAARVKAVDWPSPAFTSGEFLIYGDEKDLRRARAAFVD